MDNAGKVDGKASASAINWQLVPNSTKGFPNGQQMNITIPANSSCLVNTYADNGLYYSYEWNYGSYKDLTTPGDTPSYKTFIVTNTSSSNQSFKINHGGNGSVIYVWTFARN